MQQFAVNATSLIYAVSFEHAFVILASKNMEILYDHSQLRFFERRILMHGVKFFKLIECCRIILDP